MVMDVDDEGITYAGVNSDEEIFWNAYIYFDKLSSRDTVYTRYP